MTNTELIDGLRWCADESICCDDFSGEKCPYFDEKKDSCSVDEILHAATDALEADEKRIAELEKQLPKEGEWIVDKNGYPQIICSICDVHIPMVAGWCMDAHIKYCPNCGAKMKGEQE